MSIMEVILETGGIICLLKGFWMLVNVLIEKHEKKQEKQTLFQEEVSNFGYRLKRIIIFFLIAIICGIAWMFV